MLFAVPTAWFLLCQITYFLFRKVIWPNYVPTLPPAVYVVKAIAAAPRRWEPAVFDSCANICIPIYIFENGMAPVSEMTDFEMAKTLYEHFMSAYSDELLYILLALYLLAIVSLTVMCHCCCTKGDCTSNLSTEHDLYIRSLIYGDQPQLPVTIVSNSANVFKSLSSEKARASVRTSMWRYVASVRQNTIEKLTKIAYERAQTLFLFQNQIDSARTQVDLCESQVLAAECSLQLVKTQAQRERKSYATIVEKLIKGFRENEVARHGLQNENGSLQNQLRVHILNQERHNEQLRKLQAQIELQEIEHSRDLAKMQLLHNEQTMKYQAEIASFEDVIQTLRGSETCHSDNPQGSEREIVSPQRALKSKEREYEAALRDLQQQLEVEQDGSELKSEQSREAARLVASGKKQLEDFWHKYNELKGSCSKAEYALSVKQQQLESLDSQLQVKEKDFDILATERDTIKKELDQANIDQVKALQQLDVTRQYGITLESKVSSVEAASTQTVITLDQVTKEKQSALAALASLESESSEKIAELKLRVAELGTENNVIQEQARIDRRTRHEMEQKVQRFQHNFQDEAVQKQKTIDSLIENAATEKHQLQKIISQKNVEAFELAEKFKALETLASEMKNVKKQDSVNTLELEAATAKNKLLQKRIDEATADNLALQHKLAQMEADVQNTAITRDQKMSEQLIENLRTEKRNLEVQLSSAYVRHYDLEKAIEKLQDRVRVLEELKQSTQDHVSEKMLEVSVAGPGEATGKGTTKVEEEVHDAGSPASGPSKMREAGGDGTESANLKVGSNQDTTSVEAATSTELYEDDNAAPVAQSNAAESAVAEQVTPPAIPTSPSNQLLESRWAREAPSAASTSDPTCHRSSSSQSRSNWRSTQRGRGRGSSQW